MKSAGEILPDAMPGAGNDLICKGCGTQVQFSENQWRRPCPKCGMVITLPFVVVKRRKSQRKPSCFLCSDNGLVYYKAQEGERVYDFVARCTCTIGQGRTEIGIPSVDEVDNICDLNYLKEQNMRNWFKEAK